MSIYQENGYNNRRDYLISVADDFGVPQDHVFSIASLLGSSEDFDGLISMVSDLADRLDELGE